MRRRRLRGLAIMALGLSGAAVAARADSLLTFRRNAPEMVLPSGQVSGGRTKVKILLGPERVREEQNYSVVA